MEDVNIAAELYISNKQYDKALEVGTLICFFLLLLGFRHIFVF